MLGTILFGLFGLACLVSIAWLCSNNRGAVDWRLVATGISLQIAGDVYDIFLYGMPVPKGSELGAALQAALKELQADGTYTDILTKWGVDGGAITDITINGAQS